MRRVGSPGQLQFHILAGVFPKNGDTGPDFGKAVAYLLCIF
jgi:hypothetical protein